MFFNIVLMWFVFRNNETFQKQCWTQKTWNMQWHNARCVNGNWLGDGPNGSIYSKSVIFNFQFVMHYVWSMFEFSCNKCPAWAFQMSKKRRKKGSPNQMACFPRTIEIQGMHAFLFDKQPSISSETTCLKKLQKQTPKEQYNPQFSTPASYMNIKQLR